MKVSNHLRDVACSIMINLCLILAATTSHGADIVPKWTTRDVKKEHDVEEEFRFSEVIKQANSRLIFCGQVSLEDHIGKQHRFNGISAAEYLPDAKNTNEGSLLLFGDKDGKWLHVKLQIDKNDKLAGITCLNKGGTIKNTDGEALDIESVAWYDRESSELLLSVDESGDPLYVVNVKVDTDDWTAKKVDMSGLEGFAPFKRENGSDNGIEGITCLDPEKKSFLCISELQGIQKPPKKDLTAKDLEALRVLTDKRLAWRVDVEKKGTNWEDSAFTAESSPSPLHYDFGNQDYQHLDVGGLTSLGESVFALHKHWDGSLNEMQIVRISSGSIRAASKDKPFSGVEKLFHAKSRDYIDNSEAIVAFERGKKKKKKYIVTFTDDNYPKKQRVIATLFRFDETKSPPPVVEQISIGIKTGEEAGLNLKTPIVDVDVDNPNVLRATKSDRHLTIVGVSPSAAEVKATHEDNTSSVVTVSVAAGAKKKILRNPKSESASEKKAEVAVESRCVTCGQKKTEGHFTCDCGSTQSEGSTICDGCHKDNCHKHGCRCDGNESETSYPRLKIHDQRARVEGRDGGGDAVIWVKFPSIPELGDRRPRVSINFIEYTWTGPVRSFRTRIPDSSARRFYISANTGSGAGYPSDLLPAGLSWDSGLESYYVDLKPGMTAKVLFRDQNSKPINDRISALEAKLTARIQDVEQRVSTVEGRVGSVEDTVKSNSETLESVSAAVWPGNSSDLVYHWSKGDRGSVVAPGKGNKANIDKHGMMQLSGGSCRPIANGVDAKLLDACKRSGELSVEVVLKTDIATQGGPARIVSFSNDANNRNFTLGQEGETSGSKGSNLVFRLRTDKTDRNGTNPQVKLGTIATGKLMHIVVSYRPGQLLSSIKVDGQSAVTKSQKLTGTFTNWKPMKLIFGDEADGQRDWQGSIERLAVRSRFLNEDEAIRQMELLE